MFSEFQNKHKFDGDDNHAINTDVASFAKIAEYLRPYLQQIEMSSSLAEAHGIFTGILCSSQFDLETDKQDYLWFDLLDLKIDEQNALALEAKSEVNNFYFYVLQCLLAEDLDFQLAINENDAIMDRIDDFSVWVESFLYGLALNPASQTVLKSEQIKDFIADLIKISRAKEFDLQTDEEDEAALFELTEYVRMGVLLVFEESYLQSKSKLKPQATTVNIEEQEQEQEQEQEKSQQEINNPARFFH